MGAARSDTCSAPKEKRPGTRSRALKSPPASCGARGLGRHLADQAALVQQLRDLDGVERRALAQIVGDHPQAQAVLKARVVADPRDVDREFALDVLGGRVAAVLA